VSEVAWLGPWGGQLRYNMVSKLRKSGSTRYHDPTWVVGGVTKWYQMIQNRIQEPDRAKKGSKMKVLRIRRNQRHCVCLVFLIPTIYLLRQTGSVCERYRILFENPNRQKKMGDCTVRTVPRGRLTVQTVQSYN
jgi:hypothetical protein